MQKPKLKFWEIWNMSFGFLGIQFGFALQGGFMSRIFQTLGAEKDLIPLLWLAAPLTGLIIQPIIGYLSDHTWHSRLGRRRPYFLIGAILSSITLFFVPHSPVLWVAAGCLWILDASINISMEPFRALVADKLHESQRSYGFVIQTLIIGIGTWIASNLPWLISELGVSNDAAPGIVPMSVKVAFAIGGFVFLSSIVFSVIKTTEYPPEDFETFKKEKKEARFINDFKHGFLFMPKTMVKLGVIQFFSWFAFFTMWSMATPALTEHVFKAPIPIESSYNFENSQEKERFSNDNIKYQDAANLVGSAMGVYGLSSMAFALLLAFYTSKRRINRKYIHLASLFLGGVGFLGMFYIPDPSVLKYCFLLIGISWGSILSMPYAMLSSSVNPKQMGMMMGLFNMFIVIPQIVAALGGINILSRLIGSETIHTMTLAGISLIIAGLCNLLITNKNAISYQSKDI
ncbi:MAG: MFS transporter [Flavobacteriaceae bacterium CG2_30_34_30]|nr:SLC45 family MFS transporter [Flavobacteriales bacterium]NCT17400.1 SLC45 family MFS transporter [Flavobacteriia bacterium]OIP52025.1 MAG: MFS transporter [Flavobacteriaceae bacterium CG2_30_34_30]PIQ17466.1 MAG: MFS transporter [Flavobacteriaceae bacterium CG18_big_fil_WC_8_21_14_2_50_34_36]PIV48896.1 MAG: MFS transporter [Flavobacteriaceae bacterium CG02_land_8_20_14_3_00_34_13]PIZ07168.1 MAG: MFS transporter [Flavobacteriaceae bacterium CG_4_10_14_0_8_um_filter_34_31]PJC06819.1 MAG: MFS